MDNNIKLENQMGAMNQRMENMEALLAKIEKKIDSEFITTKEYEGYKGLVQRDIQDINARVKSIESLNSWIGRIILGAIIASLLALVLVQ